MPSLTITVYFSLFAVCSCAQIARLTLGGASLTCNEDEHQINSTAPFRLPSLVIGDESTASGSQSVAAGMGTIASGDQSMAVGYSTTASGVAATAMGLTTTAESFAEVVIGRFNELASGASATTWSASDALFRVGNGADANNRTDALRVMKDGSVSMGGKVGIGTADPDSAGRMLNVFSPDDTTGAIRAYALSSDYTGALVDIGTEASSSTATLLNLRAGTGMATTLMRVKADGSVSMGVNTTASGHIATTMGYGTTASGEQTTAIGHSTTASGSVATAMGHNTAAESFAEVVIGRFNELSTSPSATTWSASDALFRVGIGADANNRADAFRVMKDGSVYAGSVRLDVAGRRLEMKGSCGESIAELKAATAAAEKLASEAREEVREAKAATEAAEKTANEAKAEVRQLRAMVEATLGLPGAVNAP